MSTRIFSYPQSTTIMPLFTNMLSRLLVACAVLGIFCSSCNALPNFSSSSPTNVKSFGLAATTVFRKLTLENNLFSKRSPSPCEATSFRTPNSSSSSSTNVKPNNLKYLTRLARLAQLSYSKSRIMHHNGNTEVIVPVADIPRVNIKENGHIEIVVFNPSGHNNFVTMFKLVGTWANDSVWLFRTRTQTYIKEKWVVVYRGTHVLGDVVPILYLTAAATCRKDTSLPSYLDKKFRELTETIFAESNVANDSSIVLVGHSLGGSFAEAMSLRLHHEGYTAVSAVAFDPPGLPDCYRESFGSAATMAAHNLTVVTGKNNLVNNLFRAPREATAFRAREDSDGGILSSAEFVWSLRDVRMLLNSLIGDINRFHDVAIMADLLERGKVERDSETASRQVIGEVIRIAYRTGLALLNNLGSLCQDVGQRICSAYRNGLVLMNKLCYLAGNVEIPFGVIISSVAVLILLMMPGKVLAGCAILAAILLLLV